MNVILTEDQLQWLREHRNSFISCGECPLYDSVDHDSKCEHIAESLNIQSCSHVRSYAIEHATTQKSCNSVVSYYMRNANTQPAYKPHNRPSRIGKTSKWVNRSTRY